MQWGCFTHMAFCSACGTELSESVSFCPGCGNKTENTESNGNAPLASTQILQQTPQQPINVVVQQPSSAAKSGGLAIILALLWPGLDYLYLEDVGKGIGIALFSAFCLFMIIGIPIAIILWIHGLATSSRRTREHNDANQALAGVA